MLVGCLTSQQQVSVSQGRICSDNFACCHTEIEVADPTFYLTQSQYTGTGPTSPSADPRTPGAWQGSHWSANFEVTGMTRPRKKSRLKRDSNPGPSALKADALTTRPTRRLRLRTLTLFTGQTINENPDSAYLKTENSNSADTVTRNPNSTHTTIVNPICTNTVTKNPNSMNTMEP